MKTGTNNEATTRAFHSCNSCGAQFPGPFGGSSFVGHICPPVVDRDTQLRRNANDRAEMSLREAFAKMIEQTSFETAVEALGRELEQFTEDANHWNRDVWAARAEAMFTTATVGEECHDEADEDEIAADNAA